MAGKQSRRAPGEGSIFQAADGRWHAWVELPGGPPGPNGRPKRRRRKLTGRTRKEVAAKLEQARRDVAAGVVAADRRATVSLFLEEWLARAELAGDLSPGTLAGYRDVVRLYVAPALGGHRLDALAPAHVERMTGELLATGKSPRTAAIARAVLRRTLSDAVRDGLVARNAAQLARPPRQPRREGRTLDIDQARRLLAHVSTHRLEAAFVLSLTAGLRRGELLGLRHGDIDFDAGTVTIRRQLRRIAGELDVHDTKTIGSVRVVPLTELAADALRRHTGRNPGLPGAFLFTTSTGRPIDPDTWRRDVYQATLKALGEKWSPHELRHSAASIMLAAGVPLKVVSETLGHSSIRITADVYAHLLAGDRSAATAVDRALGM